MKQMLGNGGWALPRPPATPQGEASKSDGGWSVPAASGCSVPAVVPAATEHTIKADPAIKAERPPSPGAASPVAVPERGSPTSGNMEGFPALTSMFPGETDLRFGVEQVVGMLRFRSEQRPICNLCIWGTKLHRRKGQEENVGVSDSSTFGAVASKSNVLSMLIPPVVPSANAWPRMV